MVKLIQNDAKNETQFVGTTVVIEDPDMRMAFGKPISGRVTVNPDDYSVHVKIDKKRAESLVEELYKGDKSGIVAKYNPRDKKYGVSLNVVGAMYKGIGKSRIKSEFNSALDNIYARIDEEQMNND